MSTIVPETYVLYLIAIGVVVSIGKSLIKEEMDSFRVIIGKAIVTGATSLIAGSLLLFFSNLSPIAVLGIASAFATLGVEGSIKLIKDFTIKHINKTGDKSEDK